jgi:hypothetical protein
MMEKKGQKIVRIPIAARLKAARENAGYPSAKDFCDKHGFQLEKYERHENAEHAMLASEIMSYCKALKTSIHYLMVGEEFKDLKNS